jgi:hypothetical protein
MLKAAILEIKEAPILILNKDQSTSPFSLNTRLYSWYIGCSNSMKSSHVHMTWNLAWPRYYFHAGSAKRIKGEVGKK